MCRMDDSSRSFPLTHCLVSHTWRWLCVGSNVSHSCYYVITINVFLDRSTTVQSIIYYIVPPCTSLNGTRFHRRSRVDTFLRKAARAINAGKVYWKHELAIYDPYGVIHHDINVWTLAPDGQGRFMLGKCIGNTSWQYMIHTVLYITTSTCGL